MESEYQHKVLVAGEDEETNKIIHLFLKTKKIACIFADHGESAIEEIKKAKDSFSLIIADQTLSDMKGTQFLEYAKDLTQDSIRILMRSSSQMETIINAVNEGSIQRYLSKPWEEKDFAKAITSGIQLHEALLGNEKLLNLVKNQNKKLYDLNCELMETTKTHNRALHTLDNDIERIGQKIKNLSSQKPVPPTKIMDEIENRIKDNNGINPEETKTLFSETIKRLHDQFNELAQRSGFEMPGTENEIKDGAE